ncbi:MAG TPA: hypothetical protein VM264_04455 [Acidimicrobiales bacterium]|nr:hypothetical protein [Acidimicrobiales bacterium]
MLDPTPGPPPPRRLRYIVIPHPDDEFSAWSMVQRRPDLYMVFVLLTHGELTTFGDGHGLQEHLGERVPQPQPFTGAGTWRLRGQRLDSWHTFLDAMAAVDATLDVPVSIPSPSSSFELFVGARSARVVFDLGDATLTPASVSEAVHEARELRRVHLPVHEELDMVAAGYWNRHDPGSLRYVHRDHRAVHRALWSVDHGLPGPQWGRTTHGDPDAAAHGTTATVDLDLYEAAMAVDPPPADPAVNPGARRSGAFQHCYAWLQDAYWAAGERDDASIFSRAQTFWARFGTA